MRESSRDIKLLPRLESILRDVGFGLRLCLRNKIVTAAAVVSLSLAIGACTAAFSLIDALILRPLPVNDPQSLIYIALPRTRGRPRTASASTTRSSRDCAMRAGRKYGCSRMSDQSRARRDVRRAAGSRRRSTGNGSQEMRSRFSA